MAKTSPSQQETAVLKWDFIERGSMVWDTCRQMATKVLTRATTAIALYAWVQSIWHSPESDYLISQVWENVIHGITETGNDIASLVATIISNPEIFTDIFWSEIPKDSLETVNSFVNESIANTNKAVSNAIFHPKESITTVIWIAIPTFVVNFFISLVIMKDRTSGNQRRRSWLLSKWRAKDESQRIEIPKKWGKTFTRI